MPLAVQAERMQPIQRIEVGCSNAGFANASSTAARAAMAIGVLIMRWLQVFIEESSSKSLFEESVSNFDRAPWRVDRFFAVG
jgi:hypothetical protein